MKKILILLLLLIPMIASAQKVKEYSMQELFKYYGMNVSFNMQSGHIEVIDNKILDEYNLYYEVGYLFEVLDAYYYQYGIRIEKSNIQSLTFIYQSYPNNWEELYFTREELVEYSNSGTLDRARALENQLF